MMEFLEQVAEACNWLRFGKRLPAWLKDKDDPLEAVATLLESLQINLAATERKIQWLEDHSTLHQRVDILYVVDGYEIEVVNEEEAVVAGPFAGDTLSDALSVALTKRVQS